MIGFTSKFEEQQTPTNALLDKEALENIYENATTDQQKMWAKNRLLALRRTYLPHLREFIDNAISYIDEDFEPWLQASEELNNLLDLEITNDPEFNAEYSKLKKAYLIIMLKDMSIDEKTRLLNLLKNIESKQS